MPGLERIMAFGRLCQGTFASIFGRPLVPVELPEPKCLLELAPRLPARSALLVKMAIILVMIVILFNSNDDNSHKNGNKRGKLVGLMCSLDTAGWISWWSPSIWILGLETIFHDFLAVRGGAVSEKCCN